MMYYCVEASTIFSQNIYGRYRNKKKGRIAAAVLKPKKKKRDKDLLIHNWSQTDSQQLNIASKRWMIWGQLYSKRVNHDELE